MEMAPEQGTRESVGGSSRDGERGTRNPRRTASSGGFLVDSFIPRSKSLRASGQHHNRPETYLRGKRGTPEAESTPKKRSRFRWSRHRESTKESDDVGPNAVGDKEEDTGSCHFAEDVTVPESQSRSVANHTAGNVESRDDQAALGLDKDSLQIVNLALNLSESRRKGNVGYHASSQVPGGTWASSGDGRSSAAGSIPSHGSYAGHGASKSSGDDRVKLSRPSASTASNDVLNSLPRSATPDSAPQGFSVGTLARAANARRYFELRHEYLRLLPSLPPLSLHEYHSTADPSQSPQYPSHRVYNPLQAIRNRKVRFRERCPIDPEADGWNDIDKIHSWVNSVEAQYNHQTRTHLECLKLPPFQGGHVDVPSNQDADDVDAFAASPPSSLRRISRTGSLKTRRPKSDWIIFPDELLADAAWVEDAQNKTKLTDKDGNTLYPDASSLIVNDPNPEQARGKSSASTGRPSSNTSHSDARQRLSVDMKDAGRGRQPRRFRVSQRIGRSSSPSGEDLGSEKRKLRIRPRSSSGSSVDVKPYRNSLLNHTRSPGRSISPLGRQGRMWDEGRGSLSSGPSADDRYDPLSLAKIEGHRPNADMDVGYFPGIASKLSPPSSRSPSPAKRGFSRAVGSRRGHSRNSPNRKGADDDSSVDFEGVRQDSMPFTEPSAQTAQTDTEPLAPPTKASTYHVDGRRPNHHERKDSAPHESKLRGIFKGPGKIAGKFGNEVSKMGDLILKKDGVGHSRQSSFVMSDDSESDDEEDVKGEKLGIPKAILRRLPTFSDDLGRSSPRNSDKSLAKNSSQTPPSIVEPRQRYEYNEVGPTNLSSPQGRLWDLQRDAGNQMGKHSGHPVRRGHRVMQFGPEIHTIREEIKKGRIKDNSVPYSLARPPITGLAQAQPTPTSSPHELRPTLPGQSRSWSISDRSVSVSIESGVPGKQEVERTRALLLSSGIKAREIVRRADDVRSPPPEFLQRSFGSNTSIPSVPRIHEHQLASQRLLKRIETSHNSFEGSIERLPKDAFSPLKTQLSTLEDLVNKSLNTRVRAATEEAENLSMQLNTTSTLAVKQLSDTLEHGLRKRHRRLRWLRRTGFMMLEWALVGLLWWVWLIVVAFKLSRKLLYGMASGVRWILWL